jgi:hypothetical protein
VDAELGADKNVLHLGGKGFMGAVEAIRTTGWALVIMLIASSTWGDSVCEKGYRDTTPEERGTITTVLGAAKTALPAAPQGWTVVSDENISVPTSFCGDFEAEPWAYSFTRSYQHVDDQEARDKAVAAAAVDLQADMKKKQPALDALTAKMQELSQQVAAAAAKGDYAKIEEINKEIEKATAEYNQVAGAGGTTEKFNAATAEAARDIAIEIVVAVNPRREVPGDEAQTLAVPEGAQSAFRWSESGDLNDHALILIGAWKPSAEGGSEPAQPGAGVAPRSMSVRVTADGARLVSTVQSIDFKTLAATLAQ